GEHVRLADVEPHDGAGTGGGAARRHEVGEDLAVLDGPARPRVPRRAGDRVHRVRPQGPDDEHQPVRLHVFRADRDARRARSGRGPVVAHLVGARAPGEARARQRHDGRDHGALLALRGRGVDYHLHRGLSAPMSDEQQHPTVEVYLRVAGALVVPGVPLNGPLHTLSASSLLSPPMVQHLILTLVFPPLLLYGTPAWVIRPLVRPRWVLRFARWATRPLVAGALFSVPITL